MAATALYVDKKCEGDNKVYSAIILDSIPEEFKRRAQ